MMDISKERSQIVIDLMRDVTRLLGSNPTVDALNQARSLLEGFARRQELFPEAEFPWPSIEENGHCYCLYKGEDGSALYLDLLRKGSSTVPHDHGTSWAIVACIHGAEKHHLYQRTDGGTGAGAAHLERRGDLTISPGGSVSMQVGGIHAIEAVSSEPAMMLHCYGKAFEQQANRLEYDLPNETCVYSIAAAGNIEDYPLHPETHR